MGSSTSKTRRFGVDGCSTSCLGSSSRAHDSDDDDQVSDHHDEVCGIHVQQNDSESDEVKVERYQIAKFDGSNDLSNVSSNVELDEWSRADNLSRNSSHLSQAFSGRSLNRSNRFLSRFSFVPGSVSFRLGRAASVRTSRTNSFLSSSFTNSTSEEDLHLHGQLSGLVNRNENPHNGNLISSSLNSASVRSHNGDSFIDLSSSLQNNRIVSGQDLADNDNDISRLDVSSPFGSHIDIDRLNRRHGDRGNDSREHVDRNFRFGRTLSVGRLRDRVLRQSSYSDLDLSPLHQETHAASDENAVNSLISSSYPSHSISQSVYTSQNSDVGTSHSREARHHDLLEHRSNFLERRRRIRSQVRALQRLGSRFDNLSGHERYCILSGHHRTGRCSCRLGTTRDSVSNDDVGARASISRIVMLAEALFEVLDEIHHQSVVLSSRPSVSSIGSIPAPTEVVESLPVKVYTRMTSFQYEEVAQCYICLVEYEEGDQMRILPCHHEFHKNCIDKWLKEIHRVCPLCRGDICGSDSSSVES